MPVAVAGSAGLQPAATTPAVTDHYNLAGRISRIAEVFNRIAPGGGNRGNSDVYNTSMARWAGVIAENIARALSLRRSGRDFVGACPSCGYRTGFSVTEKDGHLLVYCAAGGAGALARTGQVGLVHDRDDRRTLKRRRRAGQVEKAARRHWLRLAPRAALQAVKNLGGENR